MSGKTLDYGGPLVDNYKAKHRLPLNKLSHSIGIPMIVGPWWLVRRAAEAVGLRRQSQSK
jgi:uncharacterized membrane protein YGL010W